MNRSFNILYFLPTSVQGNKKYVLRQSLLITTGKKYIDSRLIVSYNFKNRIIFIPAMSLSGEDGKSGGVGLYFLL